MTRHDVLRILRAVEEESLRTYKARIRGIFGSIARGEEGPESDIDVLVEFAGSADLFDFVGLSLFLEEKLSRPVDVVPSDTIRGEIRGAVLKEAIYL
ncbi:MAG: nucleotidyltransferase family protein [Nitrospiraceae bacterium]|nr:nucleotidyltransferase family protein [Nitrospiraceae bacterium]